MLQPPTSWFNNRFIQQVLHLPMTGTPTCSPDLAANKIRRHNSKSKAAKGKINFGLIHWTRWFFNLKNNKTDWPERGEGVRVIAAANTN